MKLYKLSRTKWTDPWGVVSDAKQIMAVRTVEFIRFGQLNDGYGVHQVQVCQDSRGREYMDVSDRVSYSPTSYFIELTEPRSTHPYWTARPTGKVLDLYGNPWKVTK